MPNGIEEGPCSYCAVSRCSLARQIQVGPEYFVTYQPPLAVAERLGNDPNDTEAPFVFFCWPVRPNILAKDLSAPEIKRQKRCEDYKSL